RSCISVRSSVWLKTRSPAQEMTNAHMRLTWRTEWPHWCILVLLAIVLIISPDQPVPIHWNFEGQVDRLADKWVVLVIIVGLYLLLALLRLLDPGRANYAQFAGPYRTIRLAVLPVPEG